MAGQKPSAELIADIYEAAVDDESWPGFARILADAVGAPTSAVWIWDRAQVRDLTVTEDGADTDRPYRAHFWRLDPWQTASRREPLERIWLGGEIFSEQTLVRTEFYNDFARHFGLFRPMAVNMQLAPGIFATASLERPGSRRLFDTGDKPKFERLVPHVKRALQLRLRQQAHGPPRRMTAATLDAFTFGIVLCDAHGRIALANAAAEDMARVTGAFTLGGTRKGIGTRVASESRRLGALIADAAAGGSGGVMRIKGPDGAVLIALVTALPPGFAPIRETTHGLALVTLRSTGNNLSLSAAMLRALFGLSPTQAEIALAIFAGKTPERIARDRNIAISTLRTHLAEIFVRTGAKNQRDLVRLLGTLPPVRIRNNS